MPLFSSRPRADSIEGILQTINMGKCDDHTIKQLQVLIDTMSDDDVRSLADVLMTNLVKYPDDIDVLTGSVKALEALPYLPKAKNEFIITLLLSLLKAPVNKKDALQRKALKSEIVKFMLFFVVEDDGYAQLMMPELISALDDTYGTISSSVFHSLQRLATEKPEYFERYSASLIKQLGSINKTTRAEAAKLIGIIAKTHPEYVGKALPFLQSLASFYPDAHVKRNASEAYQIIWRSMKTEIQAPVTVRKADADSKGFADIVKLNAGTPNPAEVQFTDDELKEIIELTRKEFKSDAEAILNSLGVGHLTVKTKEARRKVPPPKAAEPAKPKKEEKAFVVPQSGIASAMRREPEAPKAASPEPAPAPQARPKKEEKIFTAQQADIAATVRREPEAPKAPRHKAASPEPAPAPQAKPKWEEKASVAPRPDIANTVDQEVKEPEAHKTSHARVIYSEPALVPQARPKREEKAFVAPGPASAVNRAIMEPETPRPSRQKAPEPAPAVPARPKREEKAVAPPQPSIVDDILSEIKAPGVDSKPVKAKGDSKAGRTFKCPKCGRHVWAEGQLCNSCGAEEFDAMRVKGHYDIGG